MKCSSTTTRGKPCRMPALGGGSHCFAHAIDRQAQRAAARRAGGKSRGKQLQHPDAPMEDIPTDEDGVPLAELLDVENAQRKVAVDLLEGRVSAKEALARTRVLTALADRIRDTARAHQETR